jgi:hypothetical protein
MMPANTGVNRPLVELKNYLANCTGYRKIDI